MSVEGISQNESRVYDWQVIVRNVCAPVPIISYGLHKEQLKAGAGNSSLTLPSWNEFVVATETPEVYCLLQPDDQ